MTAFWLSVIAIVVSVVSVVFTGIAAFANRGLHQVELARRHEEQCPRLAGKITPAETHGEGMLGVTLLSDEALTNLELGIPDTHGGKFQGVALMRDAPAVEYGESFRRILPRETRFFRVTVSDGVAGPVRVEASCTGEKGEVWNSVFVEAEVDPAFYFTLP